MEAGGAFPVHHASAGGTPKWLSYFSRCVTLQCTFTSNLTFSDMNRIELKRNAGQIRVWLTWCLS